MRHENSVTVWIQGLKAGDGPDIERLWDRYFQRLVRLAAARLPGRARRSFDEEDVALSAFQSFCENAADGQFSQLDGRDDLWRLLATITVRKAMNAMRRETSKKRGGGRVLGESALRTDDDAGLGLAEILSREPAPDDVVQFAEQYRRLLDRLREPSLRTVALRRLEGHSIREIATALEVSTKTIERKLQVIRALWIEDSSR